MQPRAKVLETLQRKEKADLLFAVAGGNVPDVLKNLAMALIESQRAALLPFISEHYERLQRDHDGVIKVVITSAFALSDSDKASLVEGLPRNMASALTLK